MKFWVSISMLPSILSKRPIENWPLNIILTKIKTILKLKQSLFKFQRHTSVWQMKRPNKTVQNMGILMGRWVSRSELVSLPLWSRLETNTSWFLFSLSYWLSFQEVFLFGVTDKNPLIKQGICLLTILFFINSSLLDSLYWIVPSWWAIWKNLMKFFPIKTKRFLKTKYNGSKVCFYRLQLFLHKNSWTI